MNMSERIAHALAACGRTPSELANEIGISVARISQLKSGSGGIKAENLFPLARATGFTPEWLADGLGDPRSSTALGHNLVFIALLSEESSHLGEINDQRPLVLDRRLLFALEADEKKLRYFTDRQTPAFGHQHIYLVDTSHTAPQDHSVFVIWRVDGSMVTKRMIHTMSNGWILQSHNSNNRHYPDEILSEKDLSLLHIAGKIVWHGAPFE